MDPHCPVRFKSCLGHVSELGIAQIFIALGLTGVFAMLVAGTYQQDWRDNKDKSWQNAFRMLGVALFFGLLCALWATVVVNVMYAKQTKNWAASGRGRSYGMRSSYLETARDPNMSFATKQKIIKERWGVPYRGPGTTTDSI